SGEGIASNFDPRLREGEHRGRDRLTCNLTRNGLTRQLSAIDRDRRIAAADEQTRHPVAPGGGFVGRQGKAERLAQSAPCKLDAEIAGLDCFLVSRSWIARCDDAVELLVFEARK